MAHKEMMPLLIASLFLISNFIVHSHGQAPPEPGMSWTEVRDNSTAEISTELNITNGIGVETIQAPSSGQSQIETENGSANATSLNLSEAATPAPPELGPSQIESQDNSTE